jgi:hypothetical protein
LLIVFGEYVESNSVLILGAVNHVDRTGNRLPWTNAMKLLDDTLNSSSDVIILIMTLFNTVLSSLPDQDTFYDMTDTLEQQGMQRYAQFYANKMPVDCQLVEQFHIYDVSETTRLRVDLVCSSLILLVR